MAAASKDMGLAVHSTREYEYEVYGFGFMAGQECRVWALRAWSLEGGGTSALVLDVLMLAVKPFFQFCFGNCMGSCGARCCSALLEVMILRKPAAARIHHEWSS